MVASVAGDDDDAVDRTSTATLRPSPAKSTTAALCQATAAVDGVEYIALMLVLVLSSAATETVPLAATSSETTPAASISVDQYSFMQKGEKNRRTT
jgi:hypothetical protein